MQLAQGMSRLGTETAFEVLARAAELERQGRDIINLGIGQPDFKTPGHIVEAAVKALRDGHHGYTPGQGILELREAVAADLHARRGVEVSPGNICVMPGGKPTMFFAILMFGEPGAEIMYPDPGFPIYRSMIEYTGAKTRPHRAARGERVRVFRRRGAGRDHARDPADHRQLARQSDRRRHTARGGREAGEGPAGSRGAHVGRDLLPDALRGPRARQFPGLSGDPRPADPAGRLVQDLRDDRLAARLLGLARQPDRGRGAALREQPLLRQRADPVRRDRGPDRVRRTRSTR